MYLSPISEMSILCGSYKNTPCVFIPNIRNEYVLTMKKLVNYDWLAHIACNTITSSTRFKGAKENIRSWRDVTSWYFLLNQLLGTVYIYIEIRMIMVMACRNQFLTCLHQSHKSTYLERGHVQSCDSWLDSAIDCQTEIRNTGIAQ